MKSVLGLFKRSGRGPAPGEGTDSLMFSTAFMEQGLDAGMLVPWDARAVEVGARRIPASQGGRLLRGLWSKDKFMSRLSPEAMERMERFFEYAVVPADRDIVRQDEYSNWMVVLLSGSVAVDRVQPWGEHVRLAEARPGDMLGEMSLLDSGSRFSHCITLTECEVAVMDPRALDEMMANDPALAASLVGLLARKLSLRLRAVSARVTDNAR
ncbi:cyclic nucleotide-binding domain-containing protein [Ramlibacter sp. AW1]|uniref:Cyclic nucleotide-binding domain-containing protein n=1 Tax=Ramlibacter aurantiacus TaxID=2801330 RepID=A0A936ZT71_9BURK|nr:cyclic nucleotide-binding domain-containing protein [Ramlibacter aurantiacus]MBL0423256.1 cyclic nucleotide-binding domain-containing protein [Ramlibacter aurantiacus]